MSRSIRLLVPSWWLEVEVLDLRVGDRFTPFLVATLFGPPSELASEQGPEPSGEAIDQPHPFESRLTPYRWGEAHRLGPHDPDLGIALYESSELRFAAWDADVESLRSSAFYLSHEPHLSELLPRFSSSMRSGTIRGVEELLSDRTPGIDPGSDRAHDDARHGHAFHPAEGERHACLVELDLDVFEGG